MPTRQDQGNAGASNNSDDGDVALLIDYENLQVSLKRHFNLTTPRMSLIIQEALEYGRLVLSRAYAPWTSPDLAIDAENLYRQGIDLIGIAGRLKRAAIGPDRFFLAVFRDLVALLDEDGDRVAAQLAGRVIEHVG